MSRPQMTGHATEQITKLSGHVTFGEVWWAIGEWIANHGGFQAGGQTCVEIKNVGRRLELVDDKGHIRRGDKIVAMVDNPGNGRPAKIVTVMPRGSQQKDRTFRPYSEIPEAHERWGG